ncbi:carbohydrate ABC transporter substrate-binding protein, CUT1 family [Sanguibacter gelidistatuariae]|uniref:Carbohydrate ABC transporter substrate-binding protein, CUT1 family n=1 Tax=Sanguibacter gelidistatuariae TaxID=1814289 RepID=A0A1G6L8K2_9MICO|nr:extracellular solute-binding protein [Sanguibacter gelidistatuariae]SDC39629.1 carbohydrate ABC transporter substrate-binding protein, CUT1 family [Sanguibacter gelidistatuariae]
MSIQSAGTRRNTPLSMRRLTAAASLAVIGSLALAACGSSGDAAAGSADKITVWHYFSDANQVKVMDDYADMFEKTHDGVTVENVFVPYDQMNSKLISAAGAKTGPDVVVFNGADAGTLALGGALAPMDTQWDAYADKDQFPESVVHSLDGVTYAVQGYVNLLGLWYNADILAEIGVEPPTTIDELESDMAAAKDAGYSGITLSGLPQSQGEWQAFPWLSTEGFTYEAPDAAALEAGLARARGWVEDGYLTQEAVTWDQTVPFQKFAAGGVAFAQNGNWQMGTAASDAKFKYGVVPLPLGDDGQVYLGGEAEGIGSFAKNPDLAWEYLEGTYFSADGQIVAVNNVGSLPSRADAGQDPAVTDNELLKPFAETIVRFGANYPSSVIPAAAVADVQLTMGQTWSAVLGGQKSPADAATSAVATIDGLLKK